MAVRRSFGRPGIPQGENLTPLGGAPPMGGGGPPSPGGPGGSLSMPRPGMTGAPAGNANPGAQNGSPMMPPPLPPPIEPTAGGPTSPFNIQQMLQTKGPQPGGGVGGPGGPGGPGIPSGEGVPRQPLPRWGDSHGTPAAGAGAGASGLGGSEGGSQQPDLTGLGDMSTDGSGSMPPMVMLRLLKSLGRI